MIHSGITLVTGAAGFMGSYVLEYLVSLGVGVRAADRPREDTSFFDKMEVEYVPADLTQPETLPPMFAGGVDRVFHLDTISNFSTPYAKLYPTNVVGVKRFTKLAREAGVKRYIHVGSTSVYGRPYQDVPFREEGPRNPQDEYGKSKRYSKDVVWKRIAEGFAAVITLPCTVYGPRCNDGAGKTFSRPTSIAAIPGNGRKRKK
jgi:UDP-glucose 4-epimerase